MDAEGVGVAAGGVRHLRGRFEGLEVRVAGDKPRPLRAPLLLPPDRRGSLRRQVCPAAVLALAPWRHRVQDAPDHTGGLLQLQQAARHGRGPCRRRHPAGHGPDHLPADGPGLQQHASGGQPEVSVAHHAGSLDVARRPSRPAVQGLRLQALSRHPHHALEPRAPHLVVLGAALARRHAPGAVRGQAARGAWGDGEGLEAGAGEGGRPPPSAEERHGRPHGSPGAVQGVDDRGRGHDERRALARRRFEGVVQVRRRAGALHGARASRQEHVRGPDVVS
mmetsp:Transcript_12965/g.38574  ORF Transcript_12965/g.38574 Transcript_12965/m.38574 type:complete len:278 (-) Transcript_12965:333-1166(-)